MYKALSGLLLVFVFVLSACDDSSITTASSAQGLFRWITPKSITMASATDGWIVGWGFSGGDLDLRPHHTDTLHYQQGQWTAVAAPPDVNFVSVTDVAANDVWAGADGGNGLYHFDGTQWNHDPFVVPQGSFTGASRAIVSIAMASPTEGWALANNTTNNLFHYTNGAWHVAQTLDTPDISGDYSALNHITTLSATDGWAVGGDYIAHYDGTQWQLVTTPITQHADVDLRDIAMVSPNEGWAVGITTNANISGRSVLEPTGGIIMHDVAGVWSIAGTPKTQVTSLSMLSPTEGWAAGVGPGVGAFMHFQDGAWTTLATPANTTINGVAMVSATEGWAITDDDLYHYQSGSWTLAHHRGANEPGPA